MKKKIITIVLTAVLLFALTFTLTSCVDFNRSVELEGLTMDLPITFIDFGSMIPEDIVGEVDATVYASVVDGILISVAKDPAEEGEDYDFSDTELSEGDSLIDINGHTAMRSEISEGDINLKGLLMAIEQDESVWIIAAFWIDDGDDTKEAKVIEYLSTIEIQ